MCGIGGVYNRSSANEVSAEVLSRMVGLLRHRGPDQAATWRGEQVGFAHTRLQVIDLTGGRQPISDPTCKVTLVYNGELWNYRALSDQLRRAGHSFVAASDT